MTGAFAGRNVGEIFPVVLAVAKLQCEDGREYAAYVHEALFDSNPAERESLLSVHQSLRNVDNGIDDRARCERDVHGNPGLQMARFKSTRMPFYFDGTKCFFVVHPITDAELQVLPSVTITDGTVPYEPMARVHSRRRLANEFGDGRAFPLDWKRTLGFAPNHVVHKTLCATTQLVPSVESETREIMRDHFQTRLPQLKVRRSNDICYVDTFFSSITSVRGYTCWNLFAFKRTGLDVVCLMQRRSQSPTTLPRMIADCGAPNVIKSDNAPEFKGKRWTSYLENLCIKSEFTEAHHPNQNLAERRGGALKAATMHLLLATGAPLDYWCYALEYMCLVRTVLACRSLDWLTPHECHWGDRPDISVFRFVFWEPIWFCQPRQSFPNPKMSKGRFLGIAANAGDDFCYLILTEPDETETNARPRVLARSVIRRRSSDSLTPRELGPPQRDHLSSLVGDRLTFYRNDEVTVLEDPPADSEEMEVVSDVVIPSEPSSVPSVGVAPSNVDLQSGAITTDGFFEVHGPALKRPRLLDDTSALPDTCSPPRDVPQVLESLTSDDPDAVAFPAVATPTDHTGDDRVDVAVNLPGSGFFEGSVVTQDEELTPAILDNVSHQLSRVAEDRDSDEMFDSIRSHEWRDGVLMMEAQWKTDETSFVLFSQVQRDYPSETARYILANKVGNSGGRYSGGRYTRWARNYQRQFNRVLRRILRCADGVLTPGNDGRHLTISDKLPDGTRLIRRVVHSVDTTGGKRKRRKPGRLSRPVQVKYGVIIPRSVKHAYELDREDGTTLWTDAIRKEIESLLALHCFSFHSPDYKPSSDFQMARLTMIFEVKQDGRRKARLVAGGHMVDPMGITTRSTVVKGISVRLLDLIAHRDGLQILCGDIGNAFITADCLEKIYSRAGPEFGEREGSILILKKALYGLRSSSRAFRAHFADFLRAMGFSASRYDRDVWMREREEHDGYDYVCTHVDDFKIVARDPDRWKDQIAAAFLLKSVGPPAYYLGNDYNFSKDENAWVLGCATYIKECIRRIETDFGLDGDLYTHRTPLPEGCHPELDDGVPLAEDGIRRYQTLIGMAQWACTIGRLDITFAVSSLSRFSASPRTHHLELAYHLFGYLKKNPNRRIVLDSRPLLVDDELKTTSFHPDFLEDDPDASEDIDGAFPTAYGTELATSVVFDADHAHDHVTRRSISGITVFVGSTPVIWQSRRQGCIATSTYCAEFVSMRSAVEEAISIRYMLRCLGVPVIKPTDLYGDNFGVIQSAEIPDGELKTKHIAISYHYVREAIAARIVNAHWCRSYENFADLCTKALGTTIFTDLVNDVMA
ncbi:Reverse transcriptase (RNA-dependent DNA polymerase) [Fragilaria crotonensis]|nr:Reverse transcriptase (RNA-dependent DNA polymerase) [Fragilaria crotonensis]